MPIRFRCTYCNRLLGIATRKAGTETTCPHCGYAIMVPVPAEDEAKTERVSMDDVDQLLGNHVTERLSEPATQVLQPPKPAPPKATVPKSRAKSLAPTVPEAPKAEPKPPVDPNNPPLFEGDLDDLFGDTATPLEAERPRAAPTPAPDSLSLDAPPGVIVLSAQKATLLMGAVVVLLALSFAAGYFAAR